MKPISTFIIAVGVFALSGGWALAQDGDEGDNGGFDVTMTMIPEHVDLPDVVTQDIELQDLEEVPPEEVPPFEEFPGSETGETNSAWGRDRAEAAIADGRALGEAISAEAQANAENLGRGMGPDLQDLIPHDVIPDQAPPDAPGPPDLPTPPVP